MSGGVISCSSLLNENLSFPLDCAAKLSRKPAVTAVPRGARTRKTNDCIAIMLRPLSISVKTKDAEIAQAMCVVAGAPQRR